VRKVKTTPFVSYDALRCDGGLQKTRNPERKSRNYKSVPDDLGGVWWERKSGVQKGCFPYNEQTGGFSEDRRTYERAFQGGYRANSGRRSSRKRLSWTALHAPGAFRAPSAFFVSRFDQLISERAANFRVHTLFVSPPSSSSSIKFRRGWTTSVNKHTLEARAWCRLNAWSCFKSWPLCGLV
jgi:hypothetical protein